MTCQLVVIPGDPVPFGRPRPSFRRPGAFINPVRYRDWRDKARKLIVASEHHSAKGPITVEVVAVFPRPYSWPKKIAHALKWRDGVPDIDNIIKAGLDACNGLLYHDDAQVVRCVGTKLYGKGRSSGVMIHVAEANRLSVPWGLSYQPCSCWDEALHELGVGERAPAPGVNP